LIFNRRIIDQRIKIKKIIIIDYIKILKNKWLRKMYRLIQKINKSLLIKSKKVRSLKVEKKVYFCELIEGLKNEIWK
jgi:hypothetical protein